MSLWSELTLYARFASGLYRFLTHPITLEQAKATIQRRIEQRGPNLILMLEKGVYGSPNSPYLPLLKRAQVALGDIREMVGRDGVEKTLAALAAAGVTISFEEFKGRTPVVRGDLEYRVDPTAFNNPHFKRYYEVETSGSRSTPTRLPMELDHLATQVPYYMLTHEVHGILDGPITGWIGTLPDSSGFNVALNLAGYGRRLTRWVTPLVGSDVPAEFKHRFAEWFILAMSRIAGHPIPRPEPLFLDEAGKIARWMRDDLDQYGKTFTIIQVSRGVRIALAAQQMGIDLTGAVFWGGGEPPTPAKIREIRKTGARWIPGYWIVDAGSIAQGCGNPVDENDLHLMRDSFAITTTPHEVAPGQMVDAFCLTTLLPTAPRLMLNVQSDDYGIIEERACGCLFEQMGLHVHLRNIRSFSKLTGEGVTLVGSDMLRVLEEVLPAKFGGSLQDYQLIEEEDEQTSMTRISIAVSPRIQLEDEQAVIDTVLESLRGGIPELRMASATWEQAGSLRVKRVEPVWTARGKLLPLHSPGMKQI